MEVHGTIPGKYRSYFHIADDATFLEKLFDIVNAGREDAGLLDQKFLEHFHEKMFASMEYELSVTPESLGVVREEPSAEEEKAITASCGGRIVDFFEGDSSVLVMTGTLGSGKTTMVSVLRETALSAGFTSARVFALSNRVKRNLLGTIDEVESLYSTLYDFSSARVDESGHQHIPISKFVNEVAYSDIDEESHQESKSVFIVYESQLVTDSSRIDEMIQFGSGRLLSDLLTYLGIGTESGENKVVFVGDKFQLGFGSWSDSSLNPDWYPKQTSVSVIDLPDAQNPNGIQSVCLDIADAIRQGRTSNLVIGPNDQVRISDLNGEASLLESVLRSSGRHKVLSYTNRQASGLNEYIKSRLIKNGSSCCAGDYVIFENQIVAYPSMTPHAYPGSVSAFEEREPRRVDNGEFGTIEAVYDSPDTNIVLRQRVSTEEPEVELTLVRADIRLGCSLAGDAVEVYFIKEVIDSSEPNLSPTQETALQIHLASLLNELVKSNPFENSTYYLEMIESGDFQLNEAGQYRDKNDARFLTVYEKRHRAQLQKVLNSPGSEYWRWMNAARIKYGWCMTVHKAMSYDFGEVTFSTIVDGGRRNDAYFKFLYTGISRARDKVNLVRWVPISPFEKAEFGMTNQGVGHEKKCVLTTTPDTASEDILAFVDSLPNRAFEIHPIKTAQYQEQFELRADKATAKIVFDYGKDGKVQPPRRLNGDEQLFAELSSLVESSVCFEDDETQSQIEWIYRYLESDVLNEVDVEVIQSVSYVDVVRINRQGTTVLLRVTHNKKQEISSFKRASGDEELYWEAVDAIRSHYCLEPD